MLAAHPEIDVAFVFETKPGPSHALEAGLAHVDTPFVAVPDSHSPSGIRDRLNEAFPLLYRDGAPGYRLAYQNKTWRLYVRNQAKGH